MSLRSASWSAFKGLDVLPRPTCFEFNLFTLFDRCCQLPFLSKSRQGFLRQKIQKRMFWRKTGRCHAKAPILCTWSNLKTKLQWSDTWKGKRITQAWASQPEVAVSGNPRYLPKPHLSDPKTLGSLDLQQFSLSFVETSGCFWHKGPRFCCSAQRAMFDHYCNPPHQTHAVHAAHSHAAFAPQFWP